MSLTPGCPPGTCGNGAVDHGLASEQFLDEIHASEVVGVGSRGVGDKQHTIERRCAACSTFAVRMQHVRVFEQVRVCARAARAGLVLRVHASGCQRERGPRGELRVRRVAGFPAEAAVAVLRALQERDGRLKRPVAGRLGRGCRRGLRAEHEHSTRRDHGERAATRARGPMTLSL